MGPVVMMVVVAVVCAPVSGFGVGAERQDVQLRGEWEGRADHARVSPVMLRRGELLVRESREQPGSSLLSFVTKGEHVWKGLKQGGISVCASPKQPTVCQILEGDIHCPDNTCLKNCTIPRFQVPVITLFGQPPSGW